MPSFGVEAESLADDLLITDPVGRMALRDGVPEEDEVLRLARAGGGPGPTQRQDQAQSAPPTRPQLLLQWTAATYPGCGYGSGFRRGRTWALTRPEETPAMDRTAPTTRARTTPVPSTPARSTAAATRATEGTQAVAGTGRRGAGRVNDTGETRCWKPLKESGRLAE